jgi:predicted ATPase
MITKIKLKNFKIFKNEKIEVSPLTIITGINGMGKSSILQALLLLKQSYEIGYLEAKKQVDLNNDFVNLESAESLCYVGASDDKKVEISIETNEGFTHTWIIDASNPKEVVLSCIYQGNGNLNKIPLFNENFIFLEAERWGPRVIYNKKEARAYNTKLGIQGELTPTYLLNANTINEKIGIENLKHPALSGIEEGDQLYENVNAWMADIFSISVKTRVDESSPTTVKLSYNLDGGRFSAMQVGFGLTYCLSIVVALLRAKRNDLVIVENPEAHLHPSAQAKITELFCRAAQNGVQVMLETHSDHIINGALIAIREKNISVKDLSIYFVDRNDEEQVARANKLEVLESGKIRRPPQDFFDQFDKDLRRLTGF